MGKYAKVVTERHIARVICVATALLVHAGPSAATPTDPAVPDFARPFAAEGDVVLAAKITPALMDGVGGAVIIVRHALGTDRSTNPCDLLILEGRPRALSKVTSSRHTVDCQYNDIARGAESMGLDDNLIVGPGEISYSNVLSKGGSVYTFAYESVKNVWRLDRAEWTDVNAAESGSMSVYRSVVSYPVNIPLISIDAFDPKVLRKIAAKKRTPID